MCNTMVGDNPNSLFLLCVVFLRDFWWINTYKVTYLVNIFGLQKVYIVSSETRQHSEQNTELYVGSFTLVRNSHCSQKTSIINHSVFRYLGIQKHQHDWSVPCFIDSVCVCVHARLIAFNLFGVSDADVILCFCSCPVNLHCI